MRLVRFRRARLLPACAGFAIAVAGALAPGAVASLRPTADVVERFTADPRMDSRWFASGSWTWDQKSSTLAAGGGGAGTFVWNPGGHFTGQLTLRLRLLEGGGAQPRARLIFAHDAASGAHRWLEIAAGSPGRLTLGQTGTIRGSTAGVLQSWRAPVAAGAWLDLSLRIAADKSVTVSLAGKDLFTAAAAPLAPGKVGFAAVAGAVEFDQFSFVADPDGEPCVECHAGQPGQPSAANVYVWWDGRHWDALSGGDPALQQGGHGDPAGEPALSCTGLGGCHDLRQPRPEDHRNGTREGRGHRTTNSFHLRTAAIVSQPGNSWDAQLAFDGFCSTQCHSALFIRPHNGRSHASDANPATGVVQLGQKGTRPVGESLPLPVDSDVTTRALTSLPDFAPCIACHDPHGSGAPDNNNLSNMMLRMEWSNDLCRACHV